MCRDEYPPYDSPTTVRVIGGEKADGGAAWVYVTEYRVASTSAGWVPAQPEQCRCGHRQDLHVADGPCGSPTTDEGGYVRAQRCWCDRFRYPDDGSGQA